MLKNITVMAGAAMLLAGAGEAEAAFKTLTFEQRIASKGAGPLRDQDSLLVIGRIGKGPGAVANTASFQAHTNTLSVTAAWVVGTDFRLVGVNIDLVDNRGDIVASDNFTGLLSGFATSTFTASGLKVGQPYKLVLKGTAEGIAAYQITVTPSNAP